MILVSQWLPSGCHAVPDGFEVATQPAENDESAVTYFVLSLLVSYGSCVGTHAYLLLYPRTAMAFPSSILKDATALAIASLTKRLLSTKNDY